MSTEEKNQVLGYTVSGFPGTLDTFEAPEGLGEVTLYSDEVTAVCPVTGQPDYYEVEVVYEPEALCIESKSWKLYLGSFRNSGIFGEALSTVIAAKVDEAIDPLRCCVTVTQKARGGVEITSVAEGGPNA